MNTVKRTRIVELLTREDYGATVNVKGWVRTRRGSKSVNFIALNDGSTIKNVQVVADVEKFDAELLKLITTGACISVDGTLVQSVGSGQNVEVQATAIEVLGTCASDYPMQKKGQTFEYMRQHAHMRLRTN
ncbi:MAG: asparagine--tRNA ligase, partial [Bacteroidaceae bacterium]|nr:asparagine--tRNA ligase [Bacteroidaceae bacterium]